MKKQINLKLWLLAIILLVAAWPTSAQIVKYEGIEYQTYSIGAEVYNGKNCSGDVVIPESITINHHTYPVIRIGEAAFKNNCDIKSVTIPESVERIAAEAFYGCNALTSMNIPDSVISIGEQAFFSCGNLTAVTIGSSVSWLGGCAFYYSPNIINIICLPKIPPSIGYVTEEYDDNYNPINWNLVDRPPFEFDVFIYCTLYVPAESVEDYKNKEEWKDFRNIKPINICEVEGMPESTELYSIHGNTLSVDAEAGTDVVIFSIDGTILFNGNNGSANIELSTGIYILKNGTKSTLIKI